MENIRIGAEILGAIGLFLLGMIVLTDGLRKLAGDSIRTVLMKFTRSPLTGSLTGALGTAVLQSSSLTTVAAVGFVGAGLITFPDALGIIFGASVGTTLKGWIIALLGFQFDIGVIFMPIVFAGALMNLFGKGRVATTGYTIAGFGLIFVGIDYMQGSMESLQKLISFRDLPSASLTGRLALVAIGFIFTAVTQSSSAGLVASLTALYAGIINFDQAAALVIGMSIGTTLTAVMAGLGGSSAARKTAYSYVIFNFAKGIGALFLITPYEWLWETLGGAGSLERSQEIALVAFYTLFSVLGVIIILPFTGRFARLMERLAPEKVSSYSGQLEESLLEDPDIALNAVQQAVTAMAVAYFRHVNFLLGDEKSGERADLAELEKALDETEVFVEKINLEEGSGKWERFVDMIHTLDHLQRLHDRCAEDEDRAKTAAGSEALREPKNILTAAIGEVLENIGINDWESAREAARKAGKEIHGLVHTRRAEAMSDVASGELSAGAGKKHAEAIRWLRRVGRHVSRITKHIEASLLAAGK